MILGQKQVILFSSEQHLLFLAIVGAILEIELILKYVESIQIRK